MKIKSLSISLFGLLLALSVIFAPITLANNNDLSCGTPIQCAEKGIPVDPIDDPEGQVNNVLQTVVNVLSWVAGIAAVIVLIVQGLRMVLSSGDAKAVESARNGILYAVVGLIIVASAQILVRYVIGSVG